MKTTQTILLAAVAFAGGYLAGLLFAPASGRETRRRIARSAQEPSRWVGGQVHAFEARLAALEAQLQTLSRQFAEKMRETTQGALDQVLPSVPEDDEAWQIEGDELARNLRRMPRK